MSTGMATLGEIEAALVALEQAGTAREHVQVAVIGHDAGDAILREWGGFLQVRVRYEDIVCRLGGEEFAIVLPDSTLESAHEVAARICEDARTLTINHRGNQVGPITVSIGVSAFSRR